MKYFSSKILTVFVSACKFSFARGKILALLVFDRKNRNLSLKIYPVIIASINSKYFIVWLVDTVKL